MKKFLLLSTLVAFSVATLAEAKGVRFSTRSVTGKPMVSTPKKQTAQSNTAKDATFENTPHRTIPNQQTAQTNSQNRLAGFATGAAAGYVLSNMLAPTEAQASQPAAQPATEQAAANHMTQNVPAIAEFRSIGGQIDPFLVEKTDGYRRYCIADVQYLAPAQGGQTTPIIMVNPNGSPLPCHLIQ